MARLKSKSKSKNPFFLSLLFIAILYALYLSFISSQNYFRKDEIAQFNNPTANNGVGNLNRQNELLNLVNSQAETIQKLIKRFESIENGYGEAEGLRQELQLAQQKSNSAVNFAREEVRKGLEEQVSALKLELEEQRKTIEANSGNKEVNQHQGSTFFQDISPGVLPPKTEHEKECYNRFSWGLLDSWKQNKEIWCKEDQSSQIESELTCYPYQQKGKPKLSIFCEAKNFFIDFSKVKGTHSKKKPNIPQQYLDFDKGATFSTCQKTRKFSDGKLMNHMKKQLGGNQFQDNVHAPPDGSYKVIKTPTYLLARDEDCENMFHAMADHLNLFEVVHMLDLNINDLQVVLWDKHPDTSFKELYQTAFSKKHEIKRKTDYSGTVLFEKLIFHLESPAGQVHVGIMDPWTCRNSELFAAFRAHILKSYDLWDIPPPKKPSVTFSVRRRTNEKNVGRVCANEKELEAILQEGNMMDYRVVDLGTHSFREQLKIMRNTNVLVGIHGAGHMHAYFLAEEAVLVELHPPYRLDRHFRNAARMNNKIYFPYRVISDQISCKGTSDAITINKQEFRSVMDGALRLARSFYDGLSECGLRCDPNILALNRNLDKLYKPGDGQIKNPKKPRFPC